MISLAYNRICFLQKEALSISTLDQGLIPFRKPGPFELIEVPSGGKQRVIAAKKDASRADDIKGDPVDEGAIEKGRSRCIVIDPLGGPGHLRHEFVQEETSPPMGQDDIHFRKGQEELVNRPEVLQALSGVIMPDRLIGMQQKGKPRLRKGP
jgi:hypothetical protein